MAPLARSSSTHFMAHVAKLKNNRKNMMLSKFLHVTSVIVGLVGVIAFASAILGGADKRLVAAALAAIGFNAGQP